jgi:hypothetical protein
MTTEGDEWMNDAMKSKYMFMYAKDVQVLPRPDNTAIEHFRTRVGFFWFLLRNKAARDAVRAGRFHFIVKVKSK